MAFVQQLQFGKAFTYPRCIRLGKSINVGTRHPDFLIGRKVHHILQGVVLLSQSQSGIVGGSLQVLQIQVHPL